MSQEGDSGQNEPRIVRGRVDSLSLYEITDNELYILEKGSPNSVYLNFSIALLSAGVAFITALLSIDIQSGSLIVFIVFVVLSCVSLVGGVFLLLLWYKLKNGTKDVVKKIKDRVASRESEESHG